MGADGPDDRFPIGRKRLVIMATATSKTQTVELITVTLTMTVHEALAVHALASHGEDLPSDHPIHNGAREVYLALSAMFVGGDTYEERVRLYDSIELHESPGDW